MRTTVQETVIREQNFADQLAMMSLVTHKYHNSPCSYAFSDTTAVTFQMPRLYKMSILK